MVLLNKKGRAAGLTAEYYSGFSGNKTGGVFFTYKAGKV
jgi:hypothetical protein